MKQPSVMLVFGTRPEAIKMAPVVHALRAHPAVRTEILVSAQHRAMLDQVMDLFGLTADDDLDLMRPGQGLADLFGRALSAIEATIARRKPDIVLVHGDTSTTLAAAMAAFYQRVPVGHVEAGLRTGDMQAPWPEEMNRRLTAPLASLHFAPTPRAADNLFREGLTQGVHVVGNTVIDALFEVRDRLLREPGLGDAIAARFPFLQADRRVVLVTGHRRENFGEGFEQICGALADLAARRPEVQFVYPVHRNPNVCGPVERLLGNIPGIHLVEPLDYLAFVWMMMRSHLIITDSGGVQEEAPSLGKPVLVLRDVTERPEAVEAGTVRLVGTDRPRIVAGTLELLDSPELHARMATARNPYGDGRSAARIAGLVMDWLAGTSARGEHDFHFVRRPAA